MQRVNLSAVNRKSFENLVLSGGFDSFGIQREQYLATNAKGEVFLDTLMRYGQLFQVEQAQAQNSLFGGFDAVEITKPVVPHAEQWSTLEKLNKERELVGIYLSAHPLDDHAVVLKNMCNTHCSDLGRDADKKELAKIEELTFGGIVTGVVSRWSSKTNKPYGFVTIEDFDGSGEIALFGDEWTKWEGKLKEGYTVYITAKSVQRFKYNEDLYDLRIQSVEFLSDVKEKRIEKVTIIVDTVSFDDTIGADLSTVIKNNPGSTPLYFMMHDSKNNTNLLLYSKNNPIDLNATFLSYIDGNPFLNYKIN